MTDLQRVLDVLESQSVRLTNIETAINAIAVQDEKIITIRKQVNKLWMFHDTEFGAEGVVAKIQQHQSQCPKMEVSKLRDYMFRIMFALIFAYVGGALGIVAAFLK